MVTLGESEKAKHQDAMSHHRLYVVLFQVRALSDVTAIGVFCSEVIRFGSRSPPPSGSAADALSVFLLSGSVQPAPEPANNGAPPPAPAYRRSFGLWSQGVS